MYIEDKLHIELIDWCDLTMKGNQIITHVIDFEVIFFAW